MVCSHWSVPLSASLAFILHKKSHCFFLAVSLRKGHFALVSLPVVLVSLTGGVPASALICKTRTPQGAQTLLVNVYLYHACLDKEGACRTRDANTPFRAIVFSTEDCREEWAPDSVHLPSVLLVQ